MKLLSTECTVDGCAQCDEDVDKCEVCAPGYNLTDHQCSELCSSQPIYIIVYLIMSVRMCESVHVCAYKKG